MVPEGWREGRVSDLVKNLESGVSVSGEDRPLAIGEYGVLRVSAVTYGVFDPAATKVILPHNKEKAKCNPKVGQIIISRSNTDKMVGASAYIEKSYPYLYLSDKLWQTVSKPEASMCWLSYILASKHTRSILSNLATGTSGSMKNIAKSEFFNLKVSIPPFPEQKKIAEILSTWDQAIAATERLLDNSRQRKKALMQQLLTGKKRLPGFEGEWDNSTLTQHCSVATGKKDLQNKIENGEYPFFVRSNNIEKIDSYSFDGEAILIPGDGRVGEIFHYINGRFDFHQRVYKLSDFEGLLGLFIYYYLQAFFKAEAIKNSVKATVDSLRMPVFTGMRIKLPILAEQQFIVDVLSCSDRDVQVIAQRLNSLKKEKKALMQQLLTGKRRVKVDKEVA